MKLPEFNRMKVKSRWLLLAGMLAFLAGGLNQAQAQKEIIRLWPGEAPDEPGNIGEEHDRTGPDDGLVDGRRVARITNVTQPELHYYPAPEDIHNGTSVVIFPGGGYHILAWDLEGTEVADYLNSIGVSAYILKYRVPRRDPDMPWKHALQDAQRAMSIVRSRAKEQNLAPDRIGVLGFSAGGNLGFLASCFNGGRLYKPIDAVDKISADPNFAILIYPAWIVEDEESGLKDIFTVSESSPPMFFVHASDDFVSPVNSITAYLALRKAGVKSEMHIYPDGGHGYGLRPTEKPVTRWADHCTLWLKDLGLLEKVPPHAKPFAESLIRTYFGGEELPTLESNQIEAELDDCYLIQKHVVALLEEIGMLSIGGFKGAASSAAAQKNLNIDAPLSAVLFKQGRISASSNPTLPLSENPNLKIENEIGFIFNRTVTRKINSVGALKRSVRAVVPVIELPGGSAMSGSALTIKDLVSRNFGSYKYIVGEEVPVSKVDPDKISVSLNQGSQMLNESVGASAKNGQWRNLLHQVNHAIDQGYAIENDQIIITGALGKVITAKPGHYKAEYSGLGSIEFTITE